ncbi:MAG: M48 family metalloprotease [Chloroflexi bacterium]|nr:M48 family metalloprotease [Chloroflexota bacterium]MDQ3400687.1 M48 family metalloprotease [Chloroflexota bacterium]
MTRADRAFAALVGLATVSSVVLLALFATLVVRAQQLAIHGPSDTADLVAVLVLGLAICGIGLGLGSLMRQLLATASLIRSLLRRRVPTPLAAMRAAAALGMAGRIDVVADRRAFSFCYWFIRPRVCLSTGLLARLEGDELDAVLLHERSHLLRRDPLRLVIARYFAAGLYVVPVVEELVEYYTLEKELEADQDAVHALGDVGPLARALYKVLPDADQLELGLLTPVGALSATEARIDQLIDGRALPLRVRPVSVALSGGAILGAAVLALVQANTAGTLAAMPPLFAGPGLLLAPASLLFAAAVSGGTQQLRLVIR